MCSEMVEEDAEKSILESVPEEILVGSRFMNLSEIDF